VSDVSYKSGFWRKRKNKNEDNHDQQGEKKKEGTLLHCFSQEKKSKDYKQTHSK